jgi:pimeloyl-ACP methyl ester carboxylesterase
MAILRAGDYEPMQRAVQPTREAAWLLPAGLIAHEVRGLVLPDATHLLHVEHPRAVAEALAAFFARHPIKAP